MPEDIALSKIGQIAINVKDVKRATEFYRDILGMQFLFDAPNLAFFDCDGVRLMLTVPSRPELEHPSSILYYAVEDIDATYERLVQAGVRFETGPQKVHETTEYDLWMVFFRDSEDNFLALMCEQYKPAA